MTKYILGYLVFYDSFAILNIDTFKLYLLRNIIKFT